MMGKGLRNMQEKYDELKMEVVAFEKGIWTATADPASTSNTDGSRQIQGGQTALVDPTGTAGYAP